MANNRGAYESKIQNIYLLKKYLLHYLKRKRHDFVFAVDFPLEITQSVFSLRTKLYLIVQNFYIFIPHKIVPYEKYLQKYI